jgi:hypothetical protein
VAARRLSCCRPLAYDANAIQLSAMDVLAPTTMKNAAKCDTSDDKPFLENHKSLNAHCTSGNCREYAYLSVCKPHSPNLLRWTAVEFGVAAVRFFRGLLLHLKCRALRGHNQNTSTSSHGNRARLFHLVNLRQVVTSIGIVPGGVRTKAGNDQNSNQISN